MGNLPSASQSKTIPNKVVIITGANTGIGYATARELTKRGGHLILACRNEERGNAAVEAIKNELLQDSESDVKIEFMQLDLGSLSSIRRFAEEFKSKGLPLHILINNAGLMNTPKGTTVDGFETQFGTNHLGHFLLTNLLLDTMKSSAPAKIINLSSVAYKFGIQTSIYKPNTIPAKMNWDDLMLDNHYKGFTAYSQSKLANILFTKELARRLEGTDITVNAVHPGFVTTEIGRHTAGLFLLKPFGWLISRTPDEGAKTTLWVALEAEGTGEYYSNCKVVALSEAAENVEDQKRLWEISAKLTSLDE